MLQHASELEHALCVQYLYAAFTLKVGGEAGLSASQASLTEQWNQQITRIAVQEMYHLMLASNLLTAVGATPHLWRPNFPQPARHFSEINLPSMLAPFTAQTAARFMCWEQPEVPRHTSQIAEGPPWWLDFCKQCGTQAHEAHGLTAAAAPPYRSIGELYTDIKQALLDNPGWIDSTSAPQQVTSELIPFKPAVHPIANAGDAARYIDIIIEEGEGTPDWQSNSHFAYFHQIVDQLDGLEKGNGGFAAAWPTVPNPVYDPANELPGASLIDHPAVQPVGVVFNDLYRTFVNILIGVFTGGASAEQKRPLANVALALMPLVIKPLGTLLTRLPAGDQYPDAFAGPSFELPQPVPAAPTPPAEELRVVAQRCRVLSIDDTGLGAVAHAELAAIAARLETLLPMLDGVGAPARAGQ